MTEVVRPGDDEWRYIRVMAQKEVVIKSHIYWDDSRQQMVYKFSAHKHKPLKKKMFNYVLIADTQANSLQGAVEALYEKVEASGVLA